MDLVQKIDTYAPMLRNSHPPPPNNNPGRNGNDFGTHGNNWNAFSNPTDSLNAKNIKQEHTFYGNTDDQMLNDRTGMNTSLQETAESKVVDDGIEKYASMASQNIQNQASFSEPPAAPSPKGTQKCPQCPKQENGPLQLKKIHRFRSWRKW